MKDPQDIWQAHRDVLHQLYIVEGRTLKQVKCAMVSKHEFPSDIPESMYETKLRDDLNLRKYAKRGDWAIVHQLVNRRKHEGKDSRVYRYGVPVSKKQLSKEFRRNRRDQNDEQGGTTDGFSGKDLPRGFTVRSPSPEYSSPPSSHGSWQDVSGYWDSMASGGDDHVPQPVGLFDSVETTDFIDMTETFTANSDDFVDLSLLGPVPAIVPISTHTAPPVGSIATLTSALSELMRMFKPALGKLPIVELRSKYANAGDAILSTMDQSYDLTGAHTALRTTLHSTSLGACLTAEDVAELGPAWKISQISPASSQSLSPDLSFLHQFEQVLSLSSNQMLSRFEADTRKLMKWMDDHSSPGFLQFFFRIKEPTIRAAWRPLTVAALAAKRKQLFKSLLTVGVAVGLANVKFLSKSCLNGVVANEWFDIMTTMLQLGANTTPENDTVSQSRVPCLFMTSLGGHVSAMQELLKAGANTEYRDRFGCTVLVVLLDALHKTNDNRDNRIACLNTLLEAGADIDVPLLEYIQRRYSSYESILEVIRLYSPGLVPLIQDYSQASLNTRAISVVDAIEVAEVSKTAIADYLAQRPFPKGAQRTGLLHRALALSISRPRAAFNLLEAGANPNVNYKLQTPASTGSLKLSLLPVKDDIPVLHLAIRDARDSGLTEDRAALLTALLQREARLTGLALGLAISETNTEVLQFLLASRPEVVEKHGAHALVRAARVGSIEAVNLLFSMGVCLDWTLGLFTVFETIVGGTRLEPADDAYGRWRSETTQPLDLAMLEYLISMGADVNACSDKVHGTVLHSALLNPAPARSDIVRTLVRHGADATSMLGSSTILELCCEHSRDVEGVHYPVEELANFLLDAGASVKPSPWRKHGKLGNGILASLILRKADEFLVDRVIAAGADIDDPGMRVLGLSPLEVAAANGRLDMVMKLCKLGAQVDRFKMGYPTGRNALFHACDTSSLRRNHDDEGLELVRYLLGHGADPNVVANDAGISPLHMAAKSGNIRLMLLMLANGGNLAGSPTSTAIRSVLDEAAMAGRLDMVKLLLELGASSAIPGRSGYDGAVRLAMDKEFEVVAEIIREHAAQNGHDDVSWQLVRAACG